MGLTTTFFNMVKDFAKEIPLPALIIAIILDIADTKVSILTLGLAAPISIFAASIIAAIATFAIGMLIEKDVKAIPKFLVQALVVGALVAVPLPIMSIALGVVKIAGKK